MKSAVSLAALALMTLLGGCATSRSTLDIQTPTAQAAPSQGKQVFVRTVMDKRSFQDNPGSPEIPSLDPSEEQSAAIKQRAVGRKRNGFGKALGDIVLKEGQSVESVTTSAIKEAFVQSGYTVVTNKEQVGQDTYVVDADIQKFWAWMNPGFAAITLSTEIGTTLNIKSPGGTSATTVYVKAADSYQLGTESNWTEIITRAVGLYIDDLKSKLK